MKEKDNKEELTSHEPWGQFGKYVTGNSILSAWFSCLNQVHTHASAFQTRSADLYASNLDS